MTLQLDQRKSYELWVACENHELYYNNKNRQMLTHIMWR